MSHRNFGESKFWSKIKFLLKTWNVKILVHNQNLRCDSDNPNFFSDHFNLSITFTRNVSTVHPVSTAGIASAKLFVMASIWQAGQSVRMPLVVATGTCANATRCLPKVYTFRWSDNFSKKIEFLVQIRFLWLKIVFFLKIEFLVKNLKFRPCRRNWLLRLGISSFLFDSRMERWWGLY